MWTAPACVGSYQFVLCAFGQVTYRPNLPFPFSKGMVPASSCCDHLKPPGPKAGTLPM